MYQGLAEESVPRESKVPTALTVAVIAMGVAIVVGVVLLTGAIVFKMVHHDSHAHTTDVVARSEGHVASRLRLPLGAGEHVAGVVARGDGTLAVTLTSGAGARILLWNPDAGTLAGELDLDPLEVTSARH